MKSIEAEFMQNRFRVGDGPSSNTCPRWAAHLEHRTSVRTKPGRVKTSNIFAPTTSMTSIQHIPVESIHQEAVYLQNSINAWYEHIQFHFHTSSWRRLHRSHSSRGGPAAAAIRDRAGGTGRARTGCGSEDKCKLFNMRIPQMVNVIIWWLCK